ncbi:MAG: aconitase X catalytic domain-containing protein [Candidatus Bathyarchaeia archaeon]
MFLTSIEERMLRGDFGPAVQWAMELLAKYGDAVGAERLIDINNVHGLVPYPELVEIMRLEKCKLKVKCTNHIVPFPDEWKEIGMPDKDYDRQREFCQLCRKIGAINTFTCAPYQVGNVPVFGEHIVWTESFAQVFANSVIGARTNNEGIQSSLASALTGKTPKFGYHLDENRKGSVLIKIQTRLETPQEYSALGYYAGRICRSEIPVFKGIRKTPSIEQYKGLCSALRTTGSMCLFHIAGLTPEAKSKVLFREGKPSDKTSFGKEELKDSFERLSTASDGKVDLAVFGCPHASIYEIQKIAFLLNGRKIHRDVKLWVLTSNVIKSLATIMGYTDIIEKAGGRLLANSCDLMNGRRFHLFNMPFEHIDVYVTDSGKHGYYASQLLPGKKIIVSTTAKCIEAAVKGIFK